MTYDGDCNQPRRIAPEIDHPIPSYAYAKAIFISSHFFDAMRPWMSLQSVDLAGNTILDGKGEFF